MALENVFPSVNHFLCLWHICKNVLANCKRSFDTEAWDTLFAAWKSVIYADSESIFNEKWEQFCHEYNGENADLIEYLITTYISFRHRFIKCYINRLLHFETTTTSRGESGHATLKKAAGIVTESGGGWNFFVIEQ